MTSGDYNYTNDLDDGGVLSAVSHRREQNHSPLAQVVAEMGGSHADYDYLDESFSTGFDDDFEDVQAALALEDFVGDDGSNLQSELFESNSVFDIGAGEPGTRTPSAASQQSVSGTDFDTLPIAPMAKRPIEAPPLLQPLPPVGTPMPSVTRRANASSSIYGNTAANVPNLTAALVSTIDTKGPATPFKFLDTYGISSPSAPFNSSTTQAQPATNSSGVKHGKETFEHASVTKQESGAAGSSIGPYGMGTRGYTKTGGAKSSLSTAPTNAPRGAPPAPPALPSRADGEGFGFGIETFLHGNQLGFGRQPSFKRIAPAAAAPGSSSTSRPYYLIPGMMPGEISGGASLPMAADSATSASPSARTAATGDRNAEAFTTWLEALDPKSGTSMSSARSSRGGGTVSNGGGAAIRGVTGEAKNGNAGGAAGGPSIGEDFKREVDVMMRDLLGDYDVISGAAGVYAGYMNAPSGLLAPGGPPTAATNGTTGPSGRRSSFLTSGAKDAVRQLDYDAFLKDVRMLTPTTQSPTVAADTRKKPLSKSTRPAVAAVGPNPSPPVEGDRRQSAAAAVGGRKSILASSPAASGSPQQQQHPPPPPQTPQSAEGGGASGRRRRVWNTSMPARSSGEGISGAALDPSTEADTAEPPKPAPRRVSETAAHKAVSADAGLRTASATRVSRPAADLTSNIGATTRTAKTALGRSFSPPTKERHDGPLLSSPDVYADIDEDLLAGGYLTGAPLLRSTESLTALQSPPKRTERVGALVPSSPPKDGSRGAPLQRQKLHPSWKKNSPAAPSKTAEPTSGAKRTTTAAPTTAATQSKPAATHNEQQQRARTESPEVVAKAAPPSTQRRTSIPSLTANRSALSTDSGRQANPLPLPCFTPNRISTLDVLRSTTAQATSPMQRDSERKGASVVTMDSVSKASRRASTSPSTVDPIVLTDRDRAGFLQRASTRSSDSREDAEVSTSHSVSVQPRRRLMEFRTGADAGLPPSSSRSRLSVGPVGEEVRAEAVKQRDRERETQQANEERRQRIQAFMAKRKAEKQMEELRRGQLMERDRRLEAFREAQERQRIHETTAPDTSPPPPQQQQHPGCVAGSGLNAIKASQRLRKPALDRPSRQSVPTASFIPAASTVPMSPEQLQHTASPFGVAADGPEGNSGGVGVVPVPGARRRRNPSPGSSGTTAAAKAKVRSLVVFITNGEGGAAGKDAAASDGARAATAAERSEEQRRLSNSSSGATAVFEGTTVAMELCESDRSLKVLQPHERPRYYNVEEFLQINDSNAGALSRSSDKNGGVGGSHNTTGSLRSAAAAPRRRLMSLTLTEMSRKFLAGVNVALLLCSTEHAQEASVLAIREVVEGVVSHMPAQSQLFVSVASVAGGNTQDLLSTSPRTVRSTFGSSPLFGPTLDDVTYIPVTGIGHLLHTVADAYKRVKVAATLPEAGLLVTSLLLKQWRDSDVILSSYLISDAGCDASIYTAILRKSQHAPFALFHAALGGPTLTTALMATAAEDVATVVPLLNVQHRLSTVMNKTCHVGSVRRFMQLAQRELDTVDGPASKNAASTTQETGTTNHHGSSSRRSSGSSLGNFAKSNSNSRLSTAVRQTVASPSAAAAAAAPAAATAARTTLHKRLAEQVAAARHILEDPEGYQPKGAPSTDSDMGGSTTAPSIPHTAPPSAATAPRTQLTKAQEAEAMSLHLAPVQRRKSSSTVPVTAAAAVVAAASRPKLGAAGEGNGVASATGMALPTILPTVPGFKGAGGRKETTSASRAPPQVSAVPLRHQDGVPTELPSPVPPARRSINHGAATGKSVSEMPAGREGHGATPSLRFSRDVGGGAANAATSVPPLQQCAANEQSISASTEYVRRGRLNGDDAAQRNTGFMNFEDVSASQNMPLGVEKAAAGGSGPQQHQKPQPPPPRNRYASKASDQSDLPPRPAATLAATVDTGREAAQESVGPARRRVSADNARPSSGLQPFAPPSLLGGSTAAQKRLLPGATTIGSNGPQWPSTPAFEIATIPSVDSIDTSFTHDVSISMRQSSNAYEGERAPIPTSTKVRTLVIVDARCRETSNVTYDNTMVIATTEDDFEEYDVDEVREATPGQKEMIQAELLKELGDTLLMGCNAAILGADSRPTGFSAQVLKSVVHSIFAEMGREGSHRSGRLSASIVKVKGESVVDLLKDGGEAQKLVIAISPLFGSCVHGVTYADVASGAAFNDVIDAALRRATAGDNSRDYGFLFCSLLFKLRLEEEGDVQVCSLVATFAGENVGLYTSVLDRSPLVPRALFHYALGGPSYTIALLGIGSEETRANQMLQVQKRLGEMSNRATHPGSVAKFVAGIRNDLTPNLIAKYEHSRDPSERAATKEMIERLAEMVKDADALLVDFDHHQPKAYLHGDAEEQQGQQPSQRRSGGAEGIKAPPLHRLAQGTAPLTAPLSSTSGDSNNASISTPHASTTQARSDPTPAVPRALPSIIAVNPEAEGERIQSLVCFEQVMMGAGTVAVQGNSILCASQGGTRFDSDEVITCDENHRSLSSRLIDDLVAKFLAGHHTGLLAADSSYSAFTPLMLRHIANAILEAVLGASVNGAGEDNGFAFTQPPTISGELQVSIALIKDDVTADLLPIDVDATYHRFEMEHTPLYGPRVVGVTPHLVANPQDFDHFLAVAIDNADPALQTADPGIMVVSLVLTQRVTKPVEDVLVSSLLCTAVFDAVHHYERVLEGSASEPLDLFKSILHGPCFSVALLGISDEEEDPGKLLRALNDLSQVRNRAPPVNSVSRHIRELQRGIVKLKERMTTSSNGDERAYIQSRVEVAEKLLEEAESLQRNPLSLMQPRAFVPLGGSPDMR